MMSKFKKYILFYVVWGLCSPFVAVYYFLSDLKNFRFGNNATAGLKLSMVKQEARKKAFGDNSNKQEQTERFIAEVNKLIKKRERKALYKPKK